MAKTDEKKTKYVTCLLLVPETYHFYGKKDETRIRRFNFNNTREKAKKKKKPSSRDRAREKRKAIRVNMQYIVAPSYTIRAGHGIVHISLYLCTL